MADNPQRLAFDPKAWHACRGNLWRTCTVASNCYAYALNRPDYYWAVPGMGYTKMAGDKFLAAATKVFQTLSLDEFQKKLKAGAVADGLMPANSASAREGYYLAALFFSDQPDNLDFHWYRQDDDGTWSSKNGWQAPRRKDATGRIISDPRDVKDPDFPIFGGLYLVPKSGVVLRPSSVIV